MKQRARINLYRLWVLILSVPFFFACNNQLQTADAFGNFEADEVIVSAEGSGRLLQYSIEEGEQIKRGQVIGVIDTSLLVLSRSELKASLQAVAARSQQLKKTIEVHQSRLEVLQKEVVRITKMYKEGAATQQVYDDVLGKFEVAQRELQMVQSQEAAIQAEEALVNSKMALLSEQLQRCQVVSPVSGTVLQKYARAGETTAVGKPLFKVADVSSLILRAYVSGSQLHEVKIGNSVTIRYDGKNDIMHQTSGVISWVSSSAEFTPKIIQTKEDRVDLVYAVKVTVPNEEGELKIGMPAEVLFHKK